MKTPIRAIRLSDERWEAYRLLLGNEWLIKQIDRAIAKDQKKTTAILDQGKDHEAEIR